MLWIFAHLVGFRIGLDTRLSQKKHKQQKTYTKLETWKSVHRTQLMRIDTISEEIIGFNIANKVDTFVASRENRSNV